MKNYESEPNSGEASTVAPSARTSIPSKSQAESHYNELKDQYPKLASGSTYYPVKEGSDKTA